MARSLDEQQQAELTAFVNQLAAMAGYETSAEWARDSGFPASNLSKVRNKKAAIDGYNLLRLIRAAAARVSLSPDVLAVVAERDAQAGGPTPEQLAHHLQGLADLAREMIARLEAGSAPGEPPRADEAPPAQQRTRLPRQRSGR